MTDDVQTKDQPLESGARRAATDRKLLVNPPSLPPYPAPWQLAVPGWSKLEPEIHNTPANLIMKSMGTTQ